MSALPPPRSQVPALPGPAGRAPRVSGRDAQTVRGYTFNTWVLCVSTNVEKAKVEPQYDLDGKLTGIGTITIQFLDGSQYEYPGRPMGDFYDLIESSSKGRFTYYTVRGPGPSRRGMGLWQPFRQIQKPFRSAAEVARLAGRRQPKTAAQRKRTFTRGGKRNAFGAGGQRVSRPAPGIA